jgi:sarcosine oxidase subunit beta
MGVNLRFLLPAELKEVLPQINAEGVGAAAQYLDACYLNPVATTGAYARRARELGVTILEETEVTAIRLSGGKIRSVVTNKGEIATPIVVNAAGVWAPGIGRMVGIDIPITVKRVETCTWLRPWDFRGIIPTVHTLYNEQMYRCEGNDLFLTFEVVAFRRPDRLIENPNKFNEEVEKKTVEVFLEAMPRILPPMKRASYRGGYASVYDVTPDEHAILGKVPEVSGFYLCCGWSGHGFQQSPAIGELIAELITEGRTTLVDWSVFRLSRFQEGKLLSGAWGYRE